jgi:SPP1 gp7 family putative phage head morphogenesis protein
VARAKHATQRGLNMEPSNVLTRQLQRAYDRADLVARRAAKRLLPGAVATGDPLQIQHALAAIQLEIDAAMSDTLIARLANRAGAGQNRIARKSFFSALQKNTGLNIVGTDDPLARDVSPRRIRGRKTLVPKPNVEPQLLLQGFVSDNVALMANTRNGISRGMQTKLLEADLFQAENPAAALKGLLTQWTKEGVPSEIGGLTKGGKPRIVSTKKHTRMIAKDQIERLNGGLARTRQTAAGIDSFMWMPSTADTPRESHREFYGKIYTWSDGADGVLPGEAINCQCSAAAIVDKDQVLAAGAFVEITPVT